MNAVEADADLLVGPFRLEADGLALGIALAERPFEGVGDPFLLDGDEIAGALLGEQAFPLVAHVLVVRVVEDVGDGREGHLHLVPGDELEIEIAIDQRHLSAVEERAVHQLDVNKFVRGERRRLQVDIEDLGEGHFHLDVLAVVLDLDGQAGAVEAEELALIFLAGERAHLGRLGQAEGGTNEQRDQAADGRHKRLERARKEGTARLAAIPEGCAAESRR